MSTRCRKSFIPIRRQALQPSFLTLTLLCSTLLIGTMAGVISHPSTAICSTSPWRPELGVENAHDGECTIARPDPKSLGTMPVPRWRNCDWICPNAQSRTFCGTGKGVRSHFLIAGRRRAHLPDAWQSDEFFAFPPLASPHLRQRWTRPTIKSRMALVLLVSRRMKSSKVCGLHLG